MSQQKQKRKDFEDFTHEDYQNYSTVEAVAKRFNNLAAINPNAIVWTHKSVLRVDLINPIILKKKLKFSDKDTGIKMIEYGSSESFSEDLPENHWFNAVKIDDDVRHLLKIAMNSIDPPEKYVSYEQFFKQISDEELGEQIAVLSQHHHLYGKEILYYFADVNKWMTRSDIAERSTGGDNPPKRWDSMFTIVPECINLRLSKKGVVFETIRLKIFTNDAIRNIMKEMDVKHDQDEDSK